jgi:lysyl-tRNA synthetase class 1
MKTITQSPHWLDQVTQEIVAWQKQTQAPKLHVDDMKTPSGRVHTGSLRGVLLHDMIGTALLAAADQGTVTVPVVSTYVFNDLDVMDGLPHYLDQTEYSQHMGKPLAKIPAPPLEHCGIDLTNATAEELSDFKNARNFAEFYAYDFIHAFRKLGCAQEIVWSHELYESGQMNEVIRLALDNVEKFRSIYQRVADYKLPERWYPFQVVCPQCGKMGTTLTTDWDGAEVTFECQAHKVEWAEGCGHIGKVSPFDGRGKLLWKVDWPAHWRTLGINVEGAGKDHTSAGGSRDMANAICQEVFNLAQPFDVPYEWILIRGAKMSSSKGIGTSAREFTELFPAAVGRFLFANKHYGQVIDFDPTTNAIPDLFDEYDQAARIFWEQETGDTRLGRSFEIAHKGNPPQPQFLPRFRDVAIWMQHPELELAEKCAEIKGSPLTEIELATLAERQHFAQQWVNSHAPAEFQLTARAELPETAQTLNPEQLAFLDQVHQLLDQKPWQPADLQQALFDLAKTSIGPRAGFQTIYQAYLGKTAGPRAAWFLLGLDPTIKQTRQSQLAELGKNSQQSSNLPDLADGKLLNFSTTFKTTYPTATAGVAIIKGISIQKTHPELEQLKQELVDSLTGLTTETLGQYPEVTSYRQMYKTMGIDWHSRRPSPEALLRRVAQGKELYTINTCVDAYNLVVMKHRISIGAFDLDTLALPTQLTVAQGGEEILLLGDTEPTVLKPGEVHYADQHGPYNLDFNYRDAQRTCVKETTTNIILNVDGVNSISRSQVENSLQEAADLIIRFCGGTIETIGIVTTANT